MDNLSSSYTQTLPSHPAGNVPMDDENKRQIDQAKSRAKQQRTKPGEKLTKFLLRISDEIETIDREKRLNLFRSQIKAHQYMDGNFFGYVDANCEWRPAERDSPNERWYTDNQLYPYWRTALMELSRTQTEVLVAAPPGADDNMIAAAKFAKSRYDANRDKTFNARLKQTENSYALLNGITYRYTFFQWDKGREEKVPKLLKNEAKDESASLCAMCARPQVEGSDKCLNCGSDMFVDLSVGDEPDTIIGYDDLPAGCNQWIVPNPVGIIVSMQASCIEETPFLKWKQLILRSVLQSKYKGLELTSTGTESVELRYITNQQKATPAGETFSAFEEKTDSQTGRELELLEFQQVWLDYPVYCDVRFDEDMPLSNGKTLKEGQTLGEAYPDGLYFAKCGDIIADMWNEDKNRKWSSSPYGMRAGSMYGSGSSIALSDQELINDLKAIQMANAWSNGVPREFIDPNVIAELSADPQIPTTVRRDDPSQQIIGYGYAQAPPTTLSPEFYGLEDNAKTSMQNKIGAMSGTGSGGLQDSQKWGDTATAISIKRDLAVGRFSPDLELMADQLDIPQAKQFLENEQKYFTPQQWEKHKGEFGDDALKTFLSLDIHHDLIFTISPGSYMPKSDAQMQAKLISYAQIIPALAQIQNPEIIAYASEVFGIPEYLGGWNSDRAHAQKVVKRFEALADLFIEQYGDAPTNELDNPQVSQAAQAIDNWAKMPVDVFLDNHTALIDAYKDWRTTDEGRDASNVLLAAVALRIAKHMEGTAKQAQMLARTAQAAQEPLKEEADAEQQKQLALAGQQEQKQSEAQDQATQLQTIGQLADLNDRDEQRQHEKDIEAMRLAAQQREPTRAAA